MCSSVFPCWQITRCKSEVKLENSSVGIPPRHQLALTGAERLCAKALCALSTPAKQTASRSTAYNPRRHHLLSTFHRTYIAIFFHGAGVSTPPCLKHYQHPTAAILTLPLFQQRAHLTTFGAGRHGYRVVAVRGSEVLALRLASASVVCPSRDVGEVGQFVGVPGGVDVPLAIVKSAIWWAVPCTSQ